MCTIKRKILVIGQTPPPLGGQAMMIKFMIDHNYENINLYHIRMNFSKEMNERGRFSLYKIFHLFSIIFKTIYFRFKFDIDAIYYPPSNSPKVSIYRDFIFLICTRLFFKNTIFHFHAAGISEVYPSLKSFEKWFVWTALKKADLTIRSSLYNPSDGEFFEGKINKVIPLGIPPFIDELKPETKNSHDEFVNIFFMGMLNSTKGELDLLDAIKLLYDQGISVIFSLAGKFETLEYEKLFFNKVSEYGMENNVKYLGVISGSVKHEAFLNSDIFCFPSFFESESFGLVLLEAMQYSIPIVSTKWRGIQEVIVDGENGFLVDINNCNQLANKLKLLIDNIPLRTKMGENGLKLYQKKYTDKIYLNNLEKAFLLLKSK